MGGLWGDPCPTPVSVRMAARLPRCSSPPAQPLSQDDPQCLLCRRQDRPLHRAPSFCACLLGRAGWVLLRSLFCPRQHRQLDAGEALAAWSPQWLGQLPGPGVWSGVGLGVLGMRSWPVLSTRGLVFAQSSFCGSNNETPAVCQELWLVLPPRFILLNKNTPRIVLFITQLL